MGTPAGTTITNNATVSYSVSGIPAAPVVASAAFSVAELISIRVGAPAGPTTVNTPDADKVLAFTLTNVGNGSESFALTPSYTVGGDQFDPTPGSSGTLFLDVNNDGVFQSATDTAITGPIALNADQTVRILVLANIPAARTNSDTGLVSLRAVSATPGAAPAGTGAPPGTVLPGQGAGGVDAVVGLGPGGGADSGADDVATGTYVVSGVVVTIQKTVLSITDPFGNGCAVPAGTASPCFVPGATIEYRITTTVTSPSGSTIQSLQVTDSVPADTTYLPGSIRLNGVAKTDAADPDEAVCTGCGNATGTVTVNLGNVTGTAGGVVNTVDFKIRIN